MRCSWLFRWIDGRRFRGLEPRMLPIMSVLPRLTMGKGERRREGESGSDFSSVGVDFTKARDETTTRGNVPFKREMFPFLYKRWIVIK